MTTVSSNFGFKHLSAKEISESFKAIREHFANLDRPEEIIASQEFFDALKTKDGPVIHGIAQLPIRVDTALAGNTAILRYSSGKMTYFSPDAPQRTPEEEEAAMRKVMAAKPPRGLLDLFRAETIFD